ncbi:SDR family NAD(P)-dependent oxidoreductase [Phreatobacter sp.]|uniref:SDR family oxidoreductase n=1 Tax=Phreatobacter sp. TaxID=1966341 RepID=UPI0025E9817C|nr:SDR family NAD(P)-dependent oxidoreductase [Phreatobacter sp.]
MNPMSLSGRNVMVTGAAQGIGLAITKAAIDLGARVLMLDMNADQLEAAATDLPRDRVRLAAASVTDAAEVQRIVEEAAAAWDGVHGLVNNAGISRPAMFDKMTIDQWNAVIAVHLTGAFYCTQAVGRVMISRAKAGELIDRSIVNISSDAGRQGTIGQVNYAVAKSGILGATMSAAREWARYGIRANSVAFGFVDTPMTEKLRTDEKLRETYLARIPMARWASAEEVAIPVCFLLSSAASYITGQHLSVNGGSQMSA